MRSTRGFGDGFPHAFWALGRLTWLFLGAIWTVESRAAHVVELGVLDRGVLVVHVSDGDVIHDESGGAQIINRYTPELDTTAAASVSSWTITSMDDVQYGATGRHPLDCFRKTKLSGHAQMEWVGNDYRYETTYEHWIYLTLPSSLQQSMTYTLEIDPATHCDVGSTSIAFDVFSTRSEAIHVNLVGYVPDAAHKAADLYHWMGDGGARDYSDFEGNSVYLVDVGTGQAFQAGAVTFWMPSGSDVGWYNLTRSDVWTVDFSSFTTPGTYRLAVEGVGCSQDFELSDEAFDVPFHIAVQGYFYMRIGETNPKALSPPPRTPLYLPGVSPPTTIVYLTTMHPYHPQWDTFSSGDQWDRPNDWIPFRKPGHPTNSDAWGGHSDAADWDRHLAHVTNIYDMLLPFLLTGGAISDDDTGITESGNSIPDLLDEARNEVDFWLRLRDEAGGYGHGLTNPNGSHELFQAGSTAIAAWANAANAAMLADAFRVAGLVSYAEPYRDEAMAAYTFADGLADPMLDDGMGLDDAFLRGRDLKMMAAAFLYNVTGDTAFEAVVHDESVCTSGPTDLMTSGWHQLWATAGYLLTPQTIHFPALHENMRLQVIAEAMSDEAGLSQTRPSRRGTDQVPSYWRTAQNMGRTLIAHAVTDDPIERALFRKALTLEADWGLGRNPMNMIHMTTATTALAAKRSVTEAYTSGRDDGVAGVHPGHTPYMNLNDWAPAMVMGRPSALYENSHPGDVPNTWPIGETYYPSRWVWAHNEFTPRQTMRGKIALYGCLCGLTRIDQPLDALLSVNLTSLAGGTGSVSSTPEGIDCGSDCSETFAVGTPITLMATPDPGSSFTGWGDGCFGTGDSCELVMTVDRTVTATFQPEGILRTLSVTRVGTGTGRVESTPPGIDCGSECSEVFLDGTSVTLHPLVGAETTFTGWSGACSGTGDCQLTMTEDFSVTATFRSTLVPATVIYDDQLAAGWADWSWGATVDWACTSPVHQGTHAVDVTYEAWGGLSPAMASGSIDTFGYGAVTFWVHGGSGSDKTLSFYTEGTAGQSDTVDFTAVVETWTPISITLADLGFPNTISRLNFFNAAAGPLGPVSFDDIHLEPEGPLFADGFESGDPAAWSSHVP